MWWILPCHSQALQTKPKPESLNDMVLSLILICLDTQLSSFKLASESMEGWEHSFATVDCSVAEGHLAHWVLSPKSRNTRYVTFSKLLKFCVPQFLLLQNKDDYSISLIADISLKPAYLHAGECVKEWVLCQWRHSNSGGTATWRGCCAGLNNCWDPFQLRISLNSKAQCQRTESTLR